MTQKQNDLLLLGLPINCLWTYVFNQLAHDPVSAKKQGSVLSENKIHESMILVFV